MSKNLVADLVIGFRPLIGVIISKQVNYASAITTVVVSVPLSGLLFLNLVIHKFNICTFCVSVPLSGLLFLNSALIFSAFKSFKGFRPLIGVIISKR